MKKNLFVTAIAISMSIASFAQKSKLVDAEFWKGNPDLTIVKSEVSKGFDFKNIQGQADPVFIAINNSAATEVIKFLIDQPGVDMSRKIHEGRIYLHTSVGKNNLEITEYLIKKGSDINFVDANGHTPATFSGFNGSLTVEMLAVLIKNGLDIRKKYENKDGADMLLLSVGYDKELKITNYLISKGLSVKAKDDKGNNAFHYASKMGDVNILKSLIKKGVKYDNSALFAAAQGTYRSANKIETYKYLIDDLKLNPKEINSEGQSLLNLVTRKQNQEDIVSYLLSKGVGGILVDKNGNTPFITASGSKSLEVVKLLFPKVKDINAVNSKGESALLNAVRNSTGEVVEFLVQNGADVTIKDKEGHNLAYYLVESYRAPRAGGNATTGITPADDLKIKLDILKSKGLNLKTIQPGGNTLYILAAAKNDVNLLGKLVDLGIDINVQNQEGFTALHKAALIAKDDKVLKYLVSLGAKTNLKTELDETPYDLAKENENLSGNKISIEFLKID